MKNKILVLTFIVINFVSANAQINKGTYIIGANVSTNINIVPSSSNTSTYDGLSNFNLNPEFGFTPVKNLSFFINTGILFSAYNSTNSNNELVSIQYYLGTKIRLHKMFENNRFGFFLQYRIIDFGSGTEDHEITVNDSINIHYINEVSYTYLSTGIDVGFIAFITNSIGFEIQFPLINYYNYSNGYNEGGKFNFNLNPTKFSLGLKFYPGKHKQDAQ